MSGFCRTKRNRNMKWWLGWGHYWDGDYMGRTRYWKCQNWIKEACRGRLKTDIDGGNEVITTAHTCLQDHDAFYARVAVTEMEIRVETTLDEISAVFMQADHLLCGNVALRLPAPPTLFRRLQRHRASIFGSIREPRFVGDLVVPPHYYSLGDGSSMLMHDSGRAVDNLRERMLIFATPHSLRLLERNREWIADGTFKLFPLKYWTQMYTIHAVVGHQAVVCVVALLQRKTRAVYEQMLREIVYSFAALRQGPTVVHTDFEPAAIAAFETVFPGVLHYGCYFHLAQAVRHHVSTLGLDRPYRRSVVFRRCCRMLHCLAFVPAGDVLQAWRIIVASPAFQLQVQRHRAFGQLLTYFERTYIWRGVNREGLFPLTMWNVFNRTLFGAPRTSNSVEGWHYGLSVRMKRNPSVARFLTIMRIELSGVRNKSIRARAGVMLRRRKPKDVRRDNEFSAEARGYDPNGDMLAYVNRLARI